MPRLASCAETSTSSSGSAWTATKGGSVAVLVAKTRNEEEEEEEGVSPPAPLPPPPPRRSSAIGLGSARASSWGSHASQGSPPQSLQSVPRSHLTSRVGEESSEENEEE